MTAPAERAARREFVVLGDPVEHSLSPVIHAAAFEHLGLDASYVSARVGAADLPETMRRAATSGGGNVTTPHKELAARTLDRSSSRVLRTGACNCFWLAEDGTLEGDNTDVGGFLAATTLLGLDLRGARCLLLGAGGGARAVLVALAEAAVAHVDVLNRTVERARSMVDDITTSRTSVRVLNETSEVRSSYDLIVNATTLGMRAGDALPLDLGGLRAGAAIDLVYGERGTEWTRHADRLGVPATDGLEMLVAQAGLSLIHWFGAEPPLDAMREAARSELRDRRGAWPAV